MPSSGELHATEALIKPATEYDEREVAKTPTLTGDIANWKSTALASRIGLVFQEPKQQFLKASVREELEFGPRHIAKVQRRAVDEEALARRTEELLSRLRLKHVEEANPFTLSGGEKRRLSVATALATAPRVLVLDEPTFGQDANTWHELVLLIRELLDEGIAVLSVTHDLDFVKALGGRTFTVGAEHRVHRTRGGTA